ncbi:MAG: hypothetical protein OEZ06_16990 [Myxococcales bacterium]|nr:hypothetical protein [Myxococcales bacterium]
MQRTWDFEAHARHGALLEVQEVTASVTRDVVALTLRVRNPGPQPVAIEPGLLVLRLPDGETIEAAPSLLELGERVVGGLMSRLGLGQGQSEPRRTAPGASALLRVTFRELRRDLRRYGRLEVDVSSVAVEGRPAGIPPVILTAPAGAPLGQDV